MLKKIVARLKMCIMVIFCGKCYDDVTEVVFKYPDRADNQERTNCRIMLNGQRFMGGYSFCTDTDEAKLEAFNMARRHVERFKRSESSNTITIDLSVLDVISAEMNGRT